MIKKNIRSASGIYQYNPTFKKNEVGYKANIEIWCSNKSEELYTFYVNIAAKNIVISRD